MSEKTPTGTFARLMARAAEPGPEGPETKEENEATCARTPEAMFKHTPEATQQRTPETTRARTPERTPEATLPPTTAATGAAANEGAASRGDGLHPAARERVRRTFDVFSDQLWALDDMQRAIWRSSGTKPTLSALVQEALDRYLRESSS